MPHLFLMTMVAKMPRGESAPVGDEVYLCVEAVLQLLQRLFDFGHVLVLESLVHAQVVVAPS